MNTRHESGFSEESFRSRSFLHLCFDDKLSHIVAIIRQGRFEGLCLIVSHVMQGGRDSVLTYQLERLVLVQVKPALLHAHYRSWRRTIYAVAKQGLHKANSDA